MHGGGASGWGEEGGPEEEEREEGVDRLLLRLSVGVCVRGGEEPREDGPGEGWGGVKFN